VTDPLLFKITDIIAAVEESSPDGFRDAYTHLIELIQLTPDAINGCNSEQMDLVNLGLDLYKV